MQLLVKRFIIYLLIKKLFFHFSLLMFNNTDVTRHLNECNLLKTVSNLPTLSSFAQFVVIFTMVKMKIFEFLNK